MRKFMVLVEIEVHATSFADAEKKAHRVMTTAFNASNGECPKSFDTMSILKGSKINEV